MRLLSVPFPRFLPAALLAIAAAAATPPADATSGAPFMAEPGRGYTMPVRTIKEVRLQAAFRTTIHQQYDFSCGSAAIATLLTYHYGRAVTEAQVFEAMWRIGDQAKIRVEGFSLLDMKRYLESHGYRADGVQVSLDELAKVGVPAIALVSDSGYKHFVVVKGLRGERVILGDPALGTRIVPREQFDSMWLGGIFFVIRSHLDVARFNVPDDWMSRLSAPIAQSVSRDALGTLTLGIPDANRF
ncbi:MAG TPA: C39 family peptidase [Burkholderiaceae bacterium]|nr:C39 family peptidase [Burkholderiaceae bacterium]